MSWDNVLLMPTCAINYRIIWLGYRIVVLGEAGTVEVMRW
jgi:hypothetical protein